MMNINSATSPNVVETPTGDTLHRGVKMAIDSGEVDSVESGYKLFQTYRLAVAIDPTITTLPAQQAALLTIVNTARRAFLGGVTVTSNLNCSLCTPILGCRTLADAVIELGGRIEPKIPKDVPLLTIGNVTDTESPISLAVTFEDWRGGVIPTCEGRRLAETDAMTPAAVLAGALGVSEVFQHLRGNPMAGNRSVGLSLWLPKYQDWEHAPAGPKTPLLPSRLWLIGLGHLGQAYLWTLGFLPYQHPQEVELVLQDFDRLTVANDSTSLLTNLKLVGERKTRAMSRWAEARGFRTRLVERLFSGNIRINDDEPRLALGGVDNALARTAYEDAGFDCVIDSGLGAGPTEYLALRLHSFPASTTARKKWAGYSSSDEPSLLRASAYDRLAERGMDKCGLVQLISRTVGAPFVGATAATLAVAEVLRLLNGGVRVEIFDMTLHDPASRMLVMNQNQHNVNPGFTV